MATINLSPQQSNPTSADKGRNETREFSVLKQSTSDINGRLVIAEASIVVNSGQIALKVSSDSIISAINLSSEAIVISASKIKLEGYTTINSYFKVNTNGSIEAVSGKIGQWILDANGLYNITPTDGRDNLSTGFGGPNTAWGLWAGNGRFRVDQSGNLYAYSANITGAVTATSGSFTGSIYAGSGRIGGANFSTSSGGGVSISGDMTANTIVIGTSTGITWLNTSNRTLNFQSDLLNYGNLIVNQGGTFYRLKISGTSVIAENVDAFL